MSVDCDAFYAERDRRTREYQPGWEAHSHHVAVVVGRRAARTAAGQLALLALANQLSRVHRQITFVLPEGAIPVLVGHDRGARDLRKALLGLVVSIDPCGKFMATAEVPRADVSIGIGDVAEGLDWYLGAERTIGILARSPAALSDAQSTAWGGAVASCLGASAVFRAVSGLPVGPVRLSGWTWNEGARAEAGPATIPPLAIGSVLQVGAGAVGTALDYWVEAFGHETAWTLVDGDVVHLHNTNRSLLFAPRHAGWPRGEAQNKAVVAALSLHDAEPFPGWWAEWTAAPGADRTYDVVLPLANGPGVRESIAQLQSPVLLHASTSSNWSAQLHRHVPGLDDCITCRMADVPTGRFGCATGTVPGEDEGDGRSRDAALPFLSALAGLMLACALARLQAGELHGPADNWWAVDLRSAHRMVSTGRHHCREGCETVLAPTARAQIPGGRWSALDPARARVNPR